MLIYARTLVNDMCERRRSRSGRSVRKVSGVGLTVCVSLVVLLVTAILDGCRVHDQPFDRTATTLRVEPGFLPDQLPDQAQYWYDLLWVSINNPRQLPMAAEDVAKSNDTYLYGRVLNMHITSLLHALRVSGDKRFLVEIDRLAELMRATLDDRSILTYGGTSHDADGYLNWLWRYNSDPGYIDTDIHEMDEMMCHAMVAAIAYTYHVNRDKEHQYAEKAAFWSNYLTNHFEQKWRSRKQVPQGFPFLTSRLIHVYMQWVRYHYYMYRLTGDKGYLDETERMARVVAQQITTVTTPSGLAAQWTHGMTVLGEKPMGAQKVNYARYTIQAAADLHLEGVSVFAENAFMKNIATMFSSFVLDNDAPESMAAYIDGHGKERETMKRYLYSPFAQLSYWDQGGRIHDISEQIFASAETDPGNPRSIHVPAGLLFSTLKRYVDENRQQTGTGLNGGKDI